MKVRLTLSVTITVLGFFGVIWAVLGTTGEGGGWGRGNWPDFIESSGRVWKVWFGDRIVRIAFLMWFGALAELIISVQLRNMLFSVKRTLGLLEPKDKNINSSGIELAKKAVKDNAKN